MPPRNVSPECYDNMTQIQKDFWNWNLMWIAGREFYRYYGEAFMKAWDQIAVTTPLERGISMTDGNAKCDTFLATVAAAVSGYVPGWNNGDCSLDLTVYACWSHVFASSALTDEQRSTLAALMAGGNAPTGLLDVGTSLNIAGVCDAVKQDPYYTTASLPTGTCPAGQLPNPLAEGACQTPKICKDGQSFNVSTWRCEAGLPTLPGCNAGQTFDPQTFSCKDTGLNPVDVKEEPAKAKSTNWMLWAGVGAVVVGGAALIGSLRSPEYVMAENPTDYSPRKYPFKATATGMSAKWRSYTQYFRDERAARDFVDDMISKYGAKEAAIYSRPDNYLVMTAKSASGQAKWTSG